MFKSLRMVKRASIYKKHPIKMSSYFECLDAQMRNLSQSINCRDKKRHSNDVLHVKYVYAKLLFIKT